MSKEKNKEKMENQTINDMDDNLQSEIASSEEIKNENESSTNQNADEKIKSLEAELNKYKELLLRKAAEFENYKRRTENDQLNLLKYAAESLILKLLPVVDDLDRSLAHFGEETDVQKIKEGVQLIYNKFLKTLDDQGVKKIESIGQPFNVDFHEALMTRPDGSVPPHTVLDEVETGYIYKDRVIRHAKVIVSEE